MASVGDIQTIPRELFAKFQTSFYSDSVDAVSKALGVVGSPSNPSTRYADADHLQLGAVVNYPVIRRCDILTVNRMKTHRCKSHG